MVFISTHFLEQKVLLNKRRGDYRVKKEKHSFLSSTELKLLVFGKTQ